MHIVNHFAYLDAGTGSLIVQSLVGIVAGVGVFGRRVIANAALKFKNLFGGKAKPAAATTSDSASVSADKVTSSKAKASAKK